MVTLVKDLRDIPEKNSDPVEQSRPTEEASTSTADDRL